MILGILDAQLNKITIEEDSIYQRTIIGSRRLAFENIKGYRDNNSIIEIEPINSSQKKIKIASYYENRNVLRTWLKENFEDLNLLEKNQEKEEILRDDKYGWTKERRKEKLNKAKTIARIYNTIGAICGLMTLFYPNPYTLIISLSIILPIIGLFIIKQSDGMIRFVGRNNSAYISLEIGLFLTIIALILRALLDFNIYDYTNIWLPAIVISLGYILILFVGNKEFAFIKIADYFNNLVLIIMLFGYGYSTTVLTNSLFDNTTPTYFNTTVVNKQISSSKIIIYYFYLKSWGPNKIRSKMSVSKFDYKSFSPGDEITITLHNGLFDIPWYEVK